MIIWLVGLSGAGKTTIGRSLYQRLKLSNPATVFVDGDEIRQVFAYEHQVQDYSVSGRRASAERMHQICAWLDRQGIDVVCSVISMFPEVTERNRRVYSRFIEVYVDVAVDILAERDNKGLYQAALNGEIVNVVGVDIPYVEPVAPDYVIHNSFNPEDIDYYVDRIYREVN